MSKVTIEDVIPFSRWSAIDAFLAHTYSPAYVMRRRDLFEWQFKSRDGRDEATMVCAWRDERLIAVLGYMPSPLFWGTVGVKVQGTWMANWMVHPEERTGIGWTLMRRLQERFPVVLGQGANDANRSLATKLGFAFFDRIPRMLTVFSVDSAALLSRDPVTARGRLEGMVYSSHENAASASKETRSFDAESFAPDWSRYSSLGYGTVRDASYLTYRYLNHPMWRYRLVIAGPDSAPALCVFRIAHTTGAYRLPVGHIVELLFPESEIGRSCGVVVLRRALREMAAAGCAFGDFFCSASAHQEVALEAGMALEQDKVLPHRLCPIDHRDRGQNLEVWASDEMGPMPRIDEMYITKSDGDQDRPNDPFGTGNPE